MPKKLLKASPQEMMNKTIGAKRATDIAKKTATVSQNKSGVSINFHGVTVSVKTSKIQRKKEKQKVNQYPLL